MTRKRKHIPCEQRLAAALACLLSPERRNDLRGHHVSAQFVIRLFTFDHVHLHAWGGPDGWWNLDPRLRGPELKAKDKADTSRAAKAVRIDDKWDAFMRAVAKGKKPPPRKRAWPKRKLGRARA